jgi:multidrug efflux pump subunit AcrA (membrane-fusion protein)
VKFLLALSVGSFLLGGCAHETAPPPPIIAPVEIAARPRPSLTPLSFQGVVMSRATRIVSANENGTIKELRVSAGDVVEAGQVIALLDDKALRAELANLPKRAKAARTKLEKRLAQLQIVAPIGGVVSHLRIAAGERAIPGEPLARVSSAKRLQLRFALPADQTITKGTKVTAMIGNQPIPAIVRSVSPPLDAPLAFAIVDADIAIAPDDAARLLGALADISL